MTGTFIFVCDRGHVIVGQSTMSKELDFAFHLSKSQTIRNWGTTEGLAQLQNGPTEATVVDAVCTRTIPFRSVIDIIHLTKKGKEAWHKKMEDTLVKILD